MPPMSLSRPACFLIAVSAIFSTARTFCQQRVYSTARRDSAQALRQTVEGSTATLRTALANARVGVSLATGDLNSDGLQDLVTGYAVGSGGALLIQAGNAGTLMAAGGQPFAAAAQALMVPVRPDLLRTAPLSGHGFADVMLAARGDSSLYLLRGDGRGGFGAPSPIALEGAISSLIAWTDASGTEMIAAGVCGDSGCGIQVLRVDGKTAAFIPAPGAVTAIEAGSFHGGHAEDLALIAGGTVQVVDGDSLLSGSPSVETIATGVAAAAVTGGHFVYSRAGAPQIAVLGMDATLHIFSHGPLDTSVPTQAETLAARKALVAGIHPLEAKINVEAWTEVETVHNVGPGSDAVMVHGHLSGNGQDDVVVMAGGQYVQVTQSATLDKGVRINTPVVTLDSTGATVLAAVTARTAADVRMGVITAEGTMQPNYSAQFATNRTMNADSATDAVPSSASQNACINHTAGCTLRAAILVASSDFPTNGTATVDTINLTATSPYTLTATNNGSATDAVGSANYHLNLEGSVNIVGGVSGTNIVDGQANDLVFNMNPGLARASGNLDVYLTGFTVRNGANPTNGVNGYNYGGAIQADVFNSGALTLTNMTLSGSTSKLGPGGCLAVIDSNNGSQASGGTVDLESSTFTGCKTPEYGGGLDIEAGVNLTANNVTVTANMSGHSINTADGSGNGSLGGGLAVNGGYNASIMNSSISANQTLATTTVARGGGGLFLDATHGATVANSTIAGNNSLSYGGGFFIDANPGATVTLTADTITGNAIAAGATPGSDGAGVFFNNNASSNTVSSLVMHYARVHGNVGGGTHTGLYIADAQGSVSSTSTFNATDDWWGCNAIPTATPCDIAGSASGAGTLTTSPYSVLLIGVNPPSVAVGSVVVATASLAQDSGGTTYSAADDYAYLATPITSFTLTNTGPITYSPGGGMGFSSTAAPTYSNAAATESATATTAGPATASVTVDGVTVSQPFTVVSPGDLTVSSTHTGNFKAGGTAYTYTLTASNSGGASTSGTVAVKDMLPGGFTATAMSGTGWVCTVGTLTCTRSDALAGGSSYPAITLTVSISLTDAGNYTNVVTVSGGGESVTTNDSGSDTTVVVGPPVLSAVFTPATVGAAHQSALTFTFGNPSSNTVSLSQITFSFSLPSGLTLVSRANPSCTTNTTTGYRREHLSVPGHRRPGLSG